MILLIETATASCSIALAADGKIVGFKELNERNIHAEVITVFIDGLMASAGIKYDKLDAIAVSCGPGSYTGLRIGISTAKGLCFALDKPLIAIETLAAMAYGIQKRIDYTLNDDVLLCPMIDARRMEVFTAVFTAGRKQIMPASAAIISENSFEELLATNRILFFGDGAEKCRPALSQNPNAMFFTGFVNSAVDLSHQAAEKYKARAFEDVAYFEPYYLKDFIAGKKTL